MKFNITSDILSPQNKKSFEYNGYHISRIVTGISGILKDSLKAEGADIFEDKLKWDVSGDTVEFYSETRAKSAMDSRSTIWIKITIQGSQNKKDRMGNRSLMSRPLRQEFQLTVNGGLIILCMLR